MPRKKTTLSIVQTPDPSYKVADLGEVEIAAHAMSDQYIQCRDFGHTWTLWRVFRKKGYFERQLHCRRCKTNRTQTLSNRGEVLHSHYQYEEGYQLKGMGRMLADGKNVLRVEAMSRAAAKGIIKADPDEVAATKSRRRAG